MAWWAVLLIALGSVTVGFWGGLRAGAAAVPRVLAKLQPDQLANLAKRVAEERTK